MEEMWKPVVGYEGLYEVSNMGRVRSLNRNTTTGKILILSLNNRGYYFVGLSKNGKVFHSLVHRLVASAFLPNPENKPCVDHLDGNRTNCTVSNLRWVSYKENSNNPVLKKNMSKAKSQRIYQFDKELNLVNVWESGLDAAKYGFDNGHISKCCSGLRKSHKNYIWKFEKEVI